MIILNSAYLKYALTFYLLVAASSVASAATLSSTVDRNTLSSNETLTLTVSIDEQVDTSRLDLAPLAKDFEVLGSSPQSSSSFSNINGKTTTVASTVWTITLVPKREGALTIPAFSIKGAKSQAITVLVDNSKQTSSSTLPLQAQVKASTDQLYPLQQLVIEIEISAAAYVRNLNGSPLLINGAEVETLGQRTFQRVDNGVARQIVSLKYAVFAKDSGEIVIPIMTFTGLEGGQRSFFGNRGNQVVARTEQMTIPVLEAPNDKAHPWFPAENVTIISTWSADKSKMQTGTPITRTITITAQGQTSAAIPPLVRPPSPASLKSYKDQAQLASKPNENGFVSTRTESEAIVANTSGQITVPELQVNWWNVKRKRWEVVTLVAETLNVSGSAISNEESPVADSVTPTKTQENTLTSNRLWPLLCAALALLCLIQTILIFKLKRSNSSEAVDAHKPVNSSEKQNWQLLNKSLAGNDLPQVRKAILTWAASAMPDTQTVTLKHIDDLANDNDLSLALKGLEQFLYRNAGSFDTTTLAKPLANLRSKLLKTKTHLPKNTALPPLYKND